MAQHDDLSDLGKALAELDEARGVAPAMELAAYGSPYLSRPAGIKALGRLGRIEGLQSRQSHRGRGRSQGRATTVFGALRRAGRANSRGDGGATD